MIKIANFLNPLSRLGKKEYSFTFPLVANLMFCIVSEIVAIGVLKNPLAVGMYIIFINIALIIYFSFRDGILGGAVTTTITLLYYLYIIYTRHYVGQQLSSGIETTIILGIIYLFLSLVIGALKQTIDSLIEKEADTSKRLATIIQQLPIGVVITDSKGKITHANKTIETILGIKIPQNRIVGKDTSPSQSPLYQVITTGKPILDKEYVFTRPNKKKIYVKASATPIHNAKGKLIAAASIINDITAQKEQDVRKDDFVNMASHELKTPITSMKLYIEILQKRIKNLNDDKTTKAVMSIKGQIDKLQDLVNDLIDVSRLQTGKLSFHKEEFILSKLIEEIINDFEGVTRGHKIIYKGKDGIKVFADTFRIYQVVTNLLTNAVKYSPINSTINVQVKQKDGNAIVSVEDFGIGIAQNQQKKIFEKLYQVTEAREKTFPGFGMGLYISHEIIKRHKGKIWVESEKGKGSTFYFSLPALKK